VWPPVPPSALLRRPLGDPPFPLAEPGFRYYIRARHGLFEGARALGVGHDATVLAPAYHHGSEIETLARTGAKITFYDCGEALEPDPQELEQLLTPNVRVLYLVHYLGFPQDLRRWRAWCDERGLLLFEDAAQAWLSFRDGHFAGSLGDLSIFCLYKSAGLSQPGGMLCSVPPPGPAGSRRGAFSSLMGSHLAWLSQRMDLAGVTGRRRYRPFAPDPDTEFDLGDPAQRPSRLALSVVRRIGDSAIRERRRSNYAVLLKELSEHVPPPFRVLPEGASPLQFPIWTLDKGKCLERLATCGVEAADAWPLAHPLMQPGQFSMAEAWRASLVGLPVHQGLREGDLAQVVDAAKRSI
jgi:dTDP-4-amino-4,6-dideoxygalactose transaminase